MTGFFLNGFGTFKLFCMSQKMQSKKIAGVFEKIDNERFKILPVEWTHEFNTIPVCGHSK
jgi:hypothetical protein